MSCDSHAFASVHCCLVVTCWERDDLLALVGDVYCIFVTFPCCILGQVWYFIVPFPDLCCLSYFDYLFHTIIMLLLFLLYILKNIVLTASFLSFMQDSPSNKLLFAKDIPRYKDMVKNFFQEIHDKPSYSDQDLNCYLTEKVSQVTWFLSLCHQYMRFYYH